MDLGKVFQDREYVFLGRVNVSLGFGSIFLGLKGGSLSESDVFLN